MTEMRVTGGGDASGILRLSVPPVGGKALPSAGLCAQAPRGRLTIVVQCQYRRGAWAGEGLSPSPGHTDGGTAPCPRRLPEKSPPGFCTSDRRERKRADAICIAQQCRLCGGGTPPQSSGAFLVFSGQNGLQSGHYGVAVQFRQVLPGCRGGPSGGPSGRAERIREGSLSDVDVRRRGLLSSAEAGAASPASTPQ